MFPIIVLCLAFMTPMVLFLFVAKLRLDNLARAIAEFGASQKST